MAWREVHEETGVVRPLLRPGVCAVWLPGRSAVHGERDGIRVRNRILVVGHRAAHQRDRRPDFWSAVLVHAVRIRVPGTSTREFPGRLARRPRIRSYRNLHAHLVGRLWTGTLCRSGSVADRRALRP